MKSKNMKDNLEHRKIIPAQEAPRCNATAKSTGQQCKGPAMNNGSGKCRLHGGRSTGAKTDRGKLKIKAANTSHSFYSAEIKASLRRYLEAIKEERVSVEQILQLPNPLKVSLLAQLNKHQLAIETDLRLLSQLCDDEPMRRTLSRQYPKAHPSK